MTKEEIIAKANEILADEFEINMDSITPDASLKGTLGLDSLDLVDIVVIVEENFGITLTAPDFAGIKTFGDFYEFVYKNQNAGN